MQVRWIQCGGTTSSFTQKRNFYQPPAPRSVCNDTLVLLQVLPRRRLGLAAPPGPEQRAAEEIQLGGGGWGGGSTPASGSQAAGVANNSCSGI